MVFIAQHVVLGAQTTPVYSLIVEHTRKQQQTSQATQYSLYTTIEILGSKLSLFLTGLLAEYLGYIACFVVSSVVSVVFAVIVRCPSSAFTQNPNKKE